MSQRAAQLAQRIESFSNELMTLINRLTDEDWTKMCDSEQWSVGVNAHHLSTRHFAIYDMARMIIAGDPLPQLTMDQINEMSDQQARQDANCTKAQALEQLRINTEKMIDFTKGLSDEELDRKGSMPAFGGDVTTEQLIGYVLFNSAAQHFESIKTAVAG